uniref:Uncharacterized protein n=1 Tax=Knipowitschia caucasica TaxID=637954 RepID=A0AAV2K835_KNICA
MGTLTLNAESHEHELASLRSQLEREKSKFKKMQFDLQKELNIAFEENVKLGSLLDGKVPKNLIDNVDLERTVTKLNKDLTACLENNTELHVQLEELQQLPDKMAELSKQLEESECVRKSLTEELQEIHTLKRELEEKVSNCEETRKTDEDIQKELEEQLEQAASELQNAQATNEAAMLEWESRLQSLCEERDALQQRMEQVPEAGSLVLSLQEQLEEEMQKLSSEEALHQQRVSELNQQMQTVSQELVSLQQERDHSFSSLAALTEERDQLKADLQENIEMMIELQDELRITQEKIRSQKECIQKLEAQTAEESAPDQPEKHEAQHLQEHKKSSSDELQTLESRVRGLSEDKDQLQQTLAALTQQKQQLQQVLDSSTDSLQTQITELEQTLHMVSEQKKSLEEQLQNHLETSSQKEDLLSSVQEKLKEQEEINTRLCEEHSVLKQQVQSLEANCSSDELQTLESRVRGLSEDKDQLQQTLAALTQQKQQLQQVLDSSTDSLQTQITELEQTLHMVSEQKKSLEEQLQNHLQTITELEQTLHMVSEQKKSLEEQLQNHLETSSQKEDLLSSVQEKLKEQEEINTRLCEEHSVLKQQVQSLEANCSSDELQTLESRVRGLSEDKDQLQQTLAALTQQKQQLQQVLDSSTDSLQTQITELEQTLHMVSEQKKSLEEQLQNHLETSSQKEDLLSSVQEKLKEQEEINTRLCEEHSVLKQQSEALTEEVQLLRRKEETEVPALQQELSDANRTISKLREQPPSEENPEHQLSLLLHDSNTHFQKSLQDLQSMVERRLVPMQRKTLVFMAPAGFSSLPKNMVDSFRAVNFLTVRSVNAMITIQEQLMKYAQRFLQLFEELMKTDLAVFEERRLQDVLLSIRQAPSLCITDMDFMDLWRRRLQEVVHKREQYLTKIDSTMKNINGFYGDLLNAELEGKDRFETQLSEICRKEPVDLLALDVFFGTEQQQRNDYIQERDAIFKDFSKDQDESLKQLSEQVAQEKALLEDERSKRFTLQHGLESAPLKSEASLLNDNQRLLHQLHTTQDLLKILSAEKEELQKAQVKAEHLVASHKEATQLLQTELQDTCAKLQEKEEEVEELQTSLQQSQSEVRLQTSLQQSQSEWNSSAKAVEVETLNLKVSKLETESQNYRHEIQKLTSLLEAKETTLRRLKETLRSKQEEESMLEGEALHARLVRPKGLVQSSVVLEKSRLDEEAKHLKLRITELESLVSSLQAEVGKWKQRALKMKSVTEAKPKQNQETSSQKRLQFDSPRKLLGSPRKVLESPAQINSPKSRIFDGGSHSEFLLKKCPKQFFDNSSLGAAPGAEGRAEKEDWLQWPLSPNEEIRGQFASSTAGGVTYFNLTVNNGDVKLVRRHSSRMEEATPPKVIKLVPEYLLKKRKAYQAIKATQAKLALLEKRKVTKGKPLKFKRLEDFLKHSHKKHRDECRLRRNKSRPSKPPPPTTHGLGFVVRIREIKGVSPKVMKVIQMLRLRKIFSGTFVKIGKTSTAMLKMVEPYVAWGFPNLKSVRELILKRGQTRIGSKRIPLTDNAFIEKHMGEKLHRTTICSPVIGQGTV